MDVLQPRWCTAFVGGERVAHGERPVVARECKALIDAGEGRIVLIYDDATGERVEIDFRGSSEDVLRRLVGDGGSDGSPAGGSEEPAAPGKEAGPRGPGRPRLGVVGREVTLLPRHWEWLNAQPGGASVALRKLVEQARRANAGKDRERRAQEAAFRFMSAMVGDEVGFEEAARALFAADKERFEEHSESWPTDLRDYARALAADALV